MQPSILGVMEADIGRLAKCVKLQECGCKEDKKRTSLQKEFSRIFKDELSEKLYDLEHQLLNCTEKYNYAYTITCMYSKKYLHLLTYIHFATSSLLLKMSKASTFFMQVYTTHNTK